MVGIIDYGMGNLVSVYNALKFVGAETEVITTPEEIDKLSHLVIPGVGAFAMAMDNLRKMGFIQPIQDFVKTGKPVLGICLGMQLLATTGYEPVKCEGLNLIPGEVVKFADIGKRIPHVGWNGLKIETDHYLFEQVKASADFYFVHSYYFKAENPQDVLATTEYGITFTSVVTKDNVTGVQFHPEKSQKHGLKILENFVCNVHA